MKIATFKTVVPAQAGIHAERAVPFCSLGMGSRLRGNDGLQDNDCFFEVAR